MKHSFFCLLILLSPFGLLAQEVIMSGEALYGANSAIINSEIMYYKNGKPKSTSSKSTAKNNKVTKADLNFKRSEALSKTIQKDFINLLTKDNPATKLQVEKAFANNKIRTEFDNLLKSYGFSALDLADAMTAYLVINWQVVNGKPFGDKRGFEAVRQSITTTLLNSDQLKIAGNADKQTLAENFAYQSMVAMSTYKSLVSQGNAVGLSKFQQAVYQSTKQAGIDFKNYRLTNKGFIKI